MYKVFYEAMQAKGVTPYKVAKETGVSQTILSRWKKGKSIPKIDKKIKIANYLEIPIEQLIEKNN